MYSNIHMHVLIAFFIYLYKTPSLHKFIYLNTCIYNIVYLNKHYLLLFRWVDSIT